MLFFFCLQELLELLALLDPVVVWGRLVVLDQPANLAQLAQLALLEHAAHVVRLDPAEKQAHPEVLDLQDPVVTPEPQALMDNPDLLDLPAHQGHVASQVFVANQEHVEKLGSQALLAHPAHAENQDRLAAQDNLDLRDLRDRVERAARLVLMARPVAMDQLVGGFVCAYAFQNITERSPWDSNPVARRLRVCLLCWSTFHSPKF